MSFQRRDSQTRIKHVILSKYAGAWAGIIGHGIASRPGAAQLNVSFVYLDAFGGAGRYESDSDTDAAGLPTWGSPVLGMLALESQARHLRSAGISVSITGIVLEKRPEHFQQLVENLAAAPISTSRRVVDHYSGEKDEVVLIRDDSRRHLPSILEQLSDRDFLLAFIDPWGTAMSMADVQLVAGRSRTDVIVLFPVYDVDRYGTGSARKEVWDQTETDWANIRRTTASFGTEEWVRIATHEHELAEREERFASLYQEQLSQADSAISVKKIGLRFSGVDRKAYYLFLTTRDPHGALRMNEILRTAEIAEHFMIWADREARERRRSKELGVLHLPFEDVEYAPALSSASPPAAQEVADYLRPLLDFGQTYTRKDIYALLASTYFIEGEIRRGLQFLRAEGTVSYESLTSKNAPIVVRPRTS